MLVDNKLLLILGVILLVAIVLAFLWGRSNGMLKGFEKGINACKAKPVEE